MGEHVSMKRKRDDKEDVKIKFEPGKSEALISVEDVMITEVYTIHPDQRVALARLRMLRYGVGALPVVEQDGDLIGILTLRDIDLAGSDIRELLVKDLMTSELKTRKKDALMSDIVDIMLETGIQRIPIVNDENKLIGLVTQTTVIRSIRPLLK
jgi:CBS domain-containing protein